MGSGCFEPLSACDASERVSGNLGSVMESLGGEEWTRFRGPAAPIERARRRDCFCISKQVVLVLRSRKVENTSVGNAHALRARAKKHRASCSLAPRVRERSPPVAENTRFSVAAIRGAPCRFSVVVSTNRCVEVFVTQFLANFPRQTLEESSAFCSGPIRWPSATGLSSAQLLVSDSHKCTGRHHRAPGAHLFFKILARLQFERSPDGLFGSVCGLAGSQARSIRWQFASVCPLAV